MITVRFNRLNIQPGHRLLDIGCGTGRHASGLCRLNGVIVIGADRSVNELREAKNRIALSEKAGENRARQWGISAADITCLPFKDNSFHHVICSEVLEHIPDDAQAAREVLRVLKPSGNLVVSVPRYYPEKICWRLSADYHNTEGGHIRIYTKKQLTHLFEGTGLIQWGAHFAHSLHTPYWWLKCLVGPHRNDSLPVNLYHRLLTWDIMKKPKITRILDHLLNPVLGKSLVLYFKKTGN